MLTKCRLQYNEQEEKFVIYAGVCKVFDMIQIDVNDNRSTYVDMFVFASGVTTLRCPYVFSQLCVDQIVSQKHGQARIRCPPSINLAQRLEINSRWPCLQ